MNRRAFEHQGSFVPVVEEGVTVGARRSASGPVVYRADNVRFADEGGFKLGAVGGFGGSALTVGLALVALVGGAWFLGRRRK